MNWLTYLKRVVILFAIILFPDFIFYLSGRDTYLIVHSPIWVDLGMFIFIGLGIFFSIEAFYIAAQKKWKKLFFSILTLLIAGVICKITISNFVDISIFEARESVKNFLSTNNRINPRFIIRISDNDNGLYNKYLTAGDGLKSLDLLVNVPHLRLYEFEAIPNNSDSFLVRLVVSQRKKNEIWVHSSQQ